MGVPPVIYQPFFKPALPDVDLTGRTVIVTGANVGLGKEAVKHFVRLGASKVIGTARSTARGAAALAEVEADTKREGVATIWELDYGSYASVKAFCSRVASELERLDAVVLNASVATRNFELLEGEESSVTVNVISTALLGLLLLPVLRQTASKYKVTPAISVTCSEIHTRAKFPERDCPDIFKALSDPQTKTMGERYPTSKLVQLLVMREFAARTTSSSPFVVVNTITPGFNKTALFRDTKGIEAVVMTTLLKIFGWEPEVGSRTLVHATVAGDKSHGALLDNCEIENNALAPWIKTDAGQNVQKKVWAELERKLEAIQPGILQTIEGVGDSSLQS